MKGILGFLLILSMSAISHAADVRVFKLFQAQNWKEAVAVAQEYVKNNSADAQAKFVYGVALMFNGDLIQARSIFERLLVQHPQVASLHNNIGVLYLAEGKLGDAHKSFDAALTLDNRHTNAKRNLVLLKSLNGLGGGVAVHKAHVDKRGIEFLSFTNTPALPAVISPEKRKTLSPAVAPTAAASASAVNGRKLDVLSSGKINTPKEKAAISERENNPFNEDVKRQVFDALNTWLMAWAKQDIDKYLSMYSPDFEPGDNKTRAEWESQRRARISKKIQIRIDAVDVLLEVGSSTAVVATFQQHYRADGLKEISNKMLVFIRDSEKSSLWRIVDERTSY